MSWQALDLANLVCGGTTPKSAIYGSPGHGYEAEGAQNVVFQGRDSTGVCDRAHRGERRW